MKVRFLLQGWRSKFLIVAMLSQLLKFYPPPQLVIRSIRTVPKQMIRLNIFCKTLKGLNKSLFKYEPQDLENGLSTFETRAYFNLALKNLGSYMRGFIVGLSSFSVFLISPASLRS